MTCAFDPSLAYDLLYTLAAIGVFSLALIKLSGGAQ